MQKKMILDGRDVIDFSIEAPYFQALDNAPIPVFIAREDGCFILINKAFKMATGFSIADIPTIEDWARHLVSDSVSENVKQLNGMFKPEKVLKPLRVFPETNSGKPMIWDLFNAPLGRAADGMRMVIGMASDVTAKINRQRHLEHAMNQLEREVSERTKDLNATIRALQADTD